MNPVRIYEILGDQTRWEVIPPLVGGMVLTALAVLTFGRLSVYFWFLFAGEGEWFGRLVTSGVLLVFTAVAFLFFLMLVLSGIISVLSPGPLFPGGQ
ncbi:MAG: hypothetical protein ACR2RV_24625 [Verrucomicrobiales bacterium]